MATLEELAKQYGDEILKSNNQKEIAKKIAKNIKNLTYSETKKPITQIDIDKLVNALIEYLKSHKSEISLEENFGYSKNYDYVLGNTDTSGFNDIVVILTTGTKK